MSIAGPLLSHLLNGAGGPGGPAPAPVPAAPPPPVLPPPPPSVAPPTPIGQGRQTVPPFTRYPRNLSDSLTHTPNGTEKANAGATNDNSTPADDSKAKSTDTSPDDKDKASPAKSPVQPAEGVTRLVHPDANAVVNIDDAIEALKNLQQLLTNTKQEELQRAIEDLLKPAATSVTNSSVSQGDWAQTLVEYEHTLGNTTRAFVEDARINNRGSNPDRSGGETFDNQLIDTIKEVPDVEYQAYHELAENIDKLEKLKPSYDARRDQATVRDILNSGIDAIQSLINGLYGINKEIGEIKQHMDSAASSSVPPQADNTGGQKSPPIQTNAAVSTPTIAPQTPSRTDPFLSPSLSDTELDSYNKRVDDLKNVDSNAYLATNYLGDSASFKKVLADMRQSDFDAMKTSLIKNKLTEPAGIANPQKTALDLLRRTTLRYFYHPQPGKLTEPDYLAQEKANTEGACAFFPYQVKDELGKNHKLIGYPFGNAADTADAMRLGALYTKYDMEEDKSTDVLENYFKEAGEFAHKFHGPDNKTWGALTNEYYKSEVTK